MSLYSTMDTNISASGSFHVLLALGGLEEPSSAIDCTSTHSSELKTAETSEVIPDAANSLDKINRRNDKQAAEKMRGISVMFKVTCGCQHCIDILSISFSCLTQQWQQVGAKLHPQEFLNVALMS